MKWFSGCSYSIVTPHWLLEHLRYSHSRTGVPWLMHDKRMKTKWLETVFLTKTNFGMLPQQERLWVGGKCTLLFPTIMGPLGPSMPPGIPLSQPPLPTIFAQTQWGLYRTSNHMDKSAIQHIITHTTANQTTNSKGKEKKESDRPEFKVLVVGKAIIQTMYRLE